MKSPLASDVNVVPLSSSSEKLTVPVPTRDSSIQLNPRSFSRARLKAVRSNVSFGLLVPASRAPVTTAWPCPLESLKSLLSVVVPVKRTSIPLPWPSSPRTVVPVSAVPSLWTVVPFWSDGSAWIMSAAAGAATISAAIANVALSGCFIGATPLSWARRGRGTGRENRPLTKSFPRLILASALWPNSTDEWWAGSGELMNRVPTSFRFGTILRQPSGKAATAS